MAYLTERCTCSTSFPTLAESALRVAGSHRFALGPEEQPSTGRVDLTMSAPGGLGQP